MLNGHTSTSAHPLTGNGGADLPPANEIKASFPSLCYFQMQPTGSGTRTEVGNRPNIGVEGLNGNNLEHQTLLLKQKFNLTHSRPFSSPKTTPLKKREIISISHQH